jgi:hypothetical protein
MVLNLDRTIVVGKVYLREHRLDLPYRLVVAVWISNKFLARLLEHLLAALIVEIYALALFPVDLLIAYVYLLCLQ